MRNLEGFDPVNLIEMSKIYEEEVPFLQCLAQLFLDTLAINVQRKRVCRVLIGQFAWL